MPVCSAPLLSFHPACHCFSHWYAPVSPPHPPALSLNMSVCLSAFPILVCSSSIHFVPNSPHVLFCFVASFCIFSFCSACVCVCCFSIANTIPLLPSLSSFLPLWWWWLLLLLLLFTVFNESQAEQKEKNKRTERGREREESRLHFLPVSQVNTYVCCLSPKWRRP